jgi:hypothetical protein
MVAIERPVHGGGARLQHQMCAPRRPAHLLLCIHSSVQQPLHRAFRDRGRDRLVASISSTEHWPVSDATVSDTSTVLAAARKVARLLRDLARHTHPDMQPHH